MCVDGGNAGGPCVEIAAVLPFAALHRAIRELNFAAVANRPVAAAGPVASFEDRALKSSFAQFVCRDKARDSGTQNDDFLSLAEIAGELRQRRRAGSSNQSKGPHRADRSGISANLCHALNERTSSETHKGAPLLGSFGAVSRCRILGRVLLNSLDGASLEISKTAEKRRQTNQERC